MVKCFQALYENTVIMEREKTLVKNTFILALGTVIPKFANFIVLPILTAYLTKTEYGTYDLISVLCSLCLPAVTLQIQTSAFRYLIEYKSEEENKKKIITNIVVFLVPVTVIALTIMFLVLYQYTFITRLVICIYFLFEILYSTTGQISRGMLKSKIYASASVINSMANLIGVVLFVYILKMGLTGVLISLALSVAIPSLYTIKATHLFSYFSPSSFDKKILKQQISFSWPMVPNALSMWVMNASDRLVISMFLGIEANAIYAVAKKIPNIMTIAQNTFTMAWQESASLASDDKDSADYYSKMFDTIFCMMAGVMILLLACMPVLFKLLIKGDYGDSYNQMPILLLGMFFFSISAFLGGIYTAMKATKSVGITTFLAAVINLVTNLMMVKFIGVYASSISTLISYFFLAVFRMQNIKKYTEISYNKRRIISMIFVMIVFTGLGYIRFLPLYFGELLAACILMYVWNKQIVASIFKMLRAKIRH